MSKGLRYTILKISFSHKPAAHFENSWKKISYDENSLFALKHIYILSDMCGIKIKSGGIVVRKIGQNEC